MQKKMQTSRKTVDKKSKLEDKDDLLTKKINDKHKKSVNNVSTPRNFLHKTTATDIYARNNQNKEPKKVQAALKANTVSPMKDLLKSSHSSISNRSVRNKKDELKTAVSARTLPKDTKTVKKIPFNVTVNSPIARRRNEGSNETYGKKDTCKDVSVIKKEPRITKDRKDIHSKIKDKNENEVKAVDKIKLDIRNVPARRRTNTRTLEDEEIKVLTPNVVENNAEMSSLSAKLKAQPKAFFVDLNPEKDKGKKEKSSDEEISYEDDFESYESDFESYHSGSKSDETNDDDSNEKEENSYYDEGNNDNNDEVGNDKSDKHVKNDEEANLKEERMLDSGNFELRDRSATKSKPMDFIREALEEKSQDNEGKVSLDEGFQDMSSMKTLHIDVFERPVFRDFTKVKENRRKKIIFEKLKERAKIILSMVTLHEMSYNLFEMAPIPYELFMATFGRFNYKQIAVQTFEDGITEEVQTDEVFYDTKWTQSPVDFSNKDICFNVRKIKKKTDSQEFSFFSEDSNDKQIANDTYKNNPLRIYFEQKDGVGCDKMLPYQNYEMKLKDNKYNKNRLMKFLKNVESRVSNILNLNAGSTDMTNIVKTSKFPFSNGFVSISTKTFAGNAAFLKESKIINAIFSETKNNLILTVHDKDSVAIQKCVLCLWDLTLAKREPIKYLVATDNLKIGRFWGNSDGYLVGGLEDGSIHIWDLSEEAAWCNVAINQKNCKEVKKQAEINNVTEIERDREWNKENSDVNCYNQQYGSMFQASAYTSSAYNMCNNEIIDKIVGLEFIGEHNALNSVNGKRVVRQLCTLQRTGIVTTWSIVQEKNKRPSNTDIGKAFWSKMSLEIVQSIDLTDHLDSEISNVEINTSFNLSSVKKRLFNKRQERNMVKTLSRQKSLSKFDSDRPNSVAGVRNKINSIESTNVWENGVEFCHLKIVNLNNTDNYLVGKNYGEVLCFRRIMGNVKMKRLYVTNSASLITCLEVSPNKLYFLSASDSGTVHLCSILEMRVLLTLDCRKSPVAIDKYQMDFKGRFLGNVSVATNSVDSNSDFQSPILSLSHSHPLLIVAVYGNNAHIWNLKSSDSKVNCAYAALRCGSGSRSLALLTQEREVQIYKLTEDEGQLDLFNKYVSLL